MDGYKIYENSPAELFEDTHLLGNGSLGASVYGGVPYETILINHDTLWSGEEREKINPESKGNLKKARTLTLEGRLKEANNLINDSMLGYWSEAYMPLANLNITVGHTGDLRSMGQRRILLNEIPYENYKRTLYLDKALECVEYDQSGVHYKREMFVSRPDNAIIVKMTCVGGKLSFALSMDSPLMYEQQIMDGGVSITGRAPDRVEPYEPHFCPKTLYRPEDKSNSLRFACAAKIIDTDGEIRSDDFRVYLNCATYAIIAVSAATDYAGYRKKRNRDKTKVMKGCFETIEKCEGKTFEKLFNAHLDDYGALYGRLSIDLGRGLTDEQPTSKRLSLAGSIDDPSLSAMVLQYSRYLMISCSRPGTQAANLQGIWNPSVYPPWAGNYTTNINVQMNYWISEVLGISECHLPMIDLVTELSDSGKKAARKIYGAGGWVTHHNTDLWRMAELAGEDASWAWWAFGGIWMCRHLWEHYEYTLDHDYLREVAFPVLIGAAQFILDFVVTDEDGLYVTPPSTSPENKFFLPEGSLHNVLYQVGSENRFSANRADISAVCKASTMDLAMIRELFGNCLEAIDLLGEAEPLEGLIKETLLNLYPFNIGRYGQLQEWDRDYEECTPGMGHVSHLYSVYPSSVITRKGSPELFEAAHKSLIRRMRHGSGTGHWPGAWNLCLNARFLDGIQCGMLSRSLGKGLGASMLTKDSWQIDCIMGWGAGIAEMLIQSHEGFIRLLPALAPSWMTGSVSGLRARGGFVVDIEWENGQLTKTAVYSERGGQCKICYMGVETAADIPEGGRLELGKELFRSN